MAQNKRTEQKQPENNAPVATFRAGAVSVAVWKQEGANGTFYRVTPQRAYTEDEGKTWQHTTSFGRDETLALKQLLGTAWTWIVRKESEAKRAGQ